MSWKIADVIDFEWLLAEDGKLDQEALRSRNRAISPQLVRADRSQRARDRKEVFRAWLET